MNNSHYWSEYWKEDNQANEVFINKDGHKPEYLSLHWAHFLATVKSKSSIIDIACGAGSIFNELPHRHDFVIYGSDISVEALTQLSDNIENINTIQCESNNIPVDDGVMDVVVSQYGVEYSSELGFTEALRVLKPKGCFNFITHFQNGYIDKKNQQQLEGALLIKELGFIKKATSLCLSLNNKSLYEQEFKIFSEIEPILYEYIKINKKGIHAHIYNGFRKLMTQREQYDLSEILHWLNMIEKEVDNSIIRLKSMCEAAFSETRLKLMFENMNNIKQEQLCISPFYGNDENLPIAWNITGIKK